MFRIVFSIALLWLCPSLIARPVQAAPTTDAAVIAQVKAVEAVYSSFQSELEEVLNRFLNAGTISGGPADRPSVAEARVRALEAHFEPVKTAEEAFLLVSTQGVSEPGKLVDLQAAQIALYFDRLVKLALVRSLAGMPVTYSAWAKFYDLKLPFGLLQKLSGFEGTGAEDLDAIQTALTDPTSSIVLDPATLPPPGAPGSTPVSLRLADSQLRAAARAKPGIRATERDYELIFKAMAVGSLLDRHALIQRLRKDPGTAELEIPSGLKKELGQLVDFDTHQKRIRDIVREESFRAGIAAALPAIAMEKTSLEELTAQERASIESQIPAERKEGLEFLTDAFMQGFVALSVPDGIVPDASIVAEKLRAWRFVEHALYRPALITAIDEYPQYLSQLEPRTLRAVLRKILAQAKQNVLRAKFDDTDGPDEKLAAREAWIARRGSAFAGAISERVIDGLVRASQKPVFNSRARYDETLVLSAVRLNEAIELPVRELDLDTGALASALKDDLDAMGAVPRVRSWIQLFASAPNYRLARELHARIVSDLARQSTPKCPNMLLPGGYLEHRIARGCLGLPPETSPQTRTEALGKLAGQAEAWVSGVVTPYLDSWLNRSTVKPVSAEELRKAEGAQLIQVGQLFGFYYPINRDNVRLAEIHPSTRLIAAYRATLASAASKYGILGVQLQKSGPELYKTLAGLVPPRDGVVNWTSSKGAIARFALNLGYCWTARTEDCFGSYAELPDLKMPAEAAPKAEPLIDAALDRLEDNIRADLGKIAAAQHPEDLGEFVTSPELRDVIAEAFPALAEHHRVTVARVTDFLPWYQKLWQEANGALMAPLTILTPLFLAHSFAEFTRASSPVFTTVDGLMTTINPVTGPLMAAIVPSMVVDTGLSWTASSKAAATYQDLSGYFFTSPTTESFFNAQDIANKREQAQMADRGWWSNLGMTAIFMGARPLARSAKRLARLFFIEGPELRAARTLNINVDSIDYSSPTSVDGPTEKIKDAVKADTTVSKEMREARIAQIDAASTALQERIISANARFQLAINDFKGEFDLL
jgi:hypothetical protein